MSFALEYRKKMQAEARKAAAVTAPSRKKVARKIEPTDFAVDPAKKSSDTRSNSRRMLAALSVAGLILATFNSGALVQYAGGLGYNQAAMRVIIATENWHRMMEESRMTAVVEGIRHTVMAARHSEWRDFAFGLKLEPTHPYLTEPETVRTNEPVPESEAPPAAAPHVQPEMSPVMRADAAR